ncbi:hypothetical protein GTP58_04840 [Duganella sp. CY15W]|uniref:hypothetical protein n=1 Tax=Duganella sp. CY15W TaxID=2692172 RepID=UPI0013692D73|nr:hypothetical protein [Duganella sp. CY15W]MYM27639.1 hypothetical protein [Duganella sp. CY15W]
MTHDGAVQQAVDAYQEGRYEEALGLVQELFERADRSHFITMFTWSQLIEHHAPARDALVLKREAQVRLLLQGDVTFQMRDGRWPRSRFSVIHEINDMLNDSRATYELFLQLLETQPEQADNESYLALPAIVAAGDYTLAERYLRNPLERLDELNQTSIRFPLFPPAGQAPRLAAELSNYVNSLSLCLNVLLGRGQIAEAESLRQTALAGLLDDKLRALAVRQLADPSTISREVSARIE